MMMSMGNGMTSVVQMGLKDHFVDIPDMEVAITEGSCGILISPEGYGDKMSRDGQGSPILLEQCDGVLRLVVWADINQEDPTHIINLSGAQEGCRRGPAGEEQ